MDADAATRFTRVALTKAVLGSCFTPGAGPLDTRRAAATLAQLRGWIARSLAAGAPATLPPRRALLAAVHCAAQSFDAAAAARAADSAAPPAATPRAAKLARVDAGPRGSGHAAVAEAASEEAAAPLGGLVEDTTRACAAAHAARGLVGVGDVAMERAVSALAASFTRALLAALQRGEVAGVDGDLPGGESTSPLGGAPPQSPRWLAVTELQQQPHAPPGGSHPTSAGPLTRSTGRQQQRPARDAVGTARADAHELAAAFTRVGCACVSLGAAPGDADEGRLGAAQSQARLAAALLGPVWGALAALGSAMGRLAAWLEADEGGNGIGDDGGRVACVAPPALPRLAACGAPRLFAGAEQPYDEAEGEDTIKGEGGGCVCCGSCSSACGGATGGGATLSFRRPAAAESPHSTPRSLCFSSGSGSGEWGSPAHTGNGDQMAGAALLPPPPPPTCHPGAAAAPPPPLGGPRPSHAHQQRPTSRTGLHAAATRALELHAHAAGLLLAAGDAVLHTALLAVAAGAAAASSWEAGAVFAAADPQARSARLATQLARARAAAGGLAAAAAVRTRALRLVAAGQLADAGFARMLAACVAHAPHAASHWPATVLRVEGVRQRLLRACAGGV